MKRTTKLTLAVLVIGGVIASGLRYAAIRATADSRFKGGASQRAFDPGRDASTDLRIAQEQARLQHKNVLIDVGGNWCPSCIVLDRTMKSDTTLQSLLDRDYVLVHINWSSDNHNEKVLSRYPPPQGYPALYVTGPDGHLIKAQNTDELIESTQEAVYSHAAIAAFLTRYAQTA